MIYWDLAGRNKSKKLDQHHFSLFFELTGLWGDKLFKYFVASGQNEISLPEFIETMSISCFIQPKSSGLLFKLKHKFCSISSKILKMME